jgi:hypothetical protein
MPAYDTNLFDPPAPLALVTLRNPQTAISVSDVPMHLDSGADATLIPSNFVNQLELNIDSDAVYELRGFDGTLSLASVVRLEILFLNRTFRGRFLIIDQEWGILGRNVLNLVSLLFDGPKLNWSELHHR